jgi:3-phenylpropionate/trans-cinnamate dioxygenase ferredoxin component
MERYERIASLKDLPDGGRMSVEVEEIPALLIRAAGRVYCIEDVCSHDGQPLTDGPIDNGEITCPRHGARFALASGAPMCMPATQPIRTFPVEVRGDEILVQVRG